MFIVELLGGLGNQMFQYAFKRAFEIKTNTDIKLNANTFKDYKLHKFKLYAFNIDNKFASEDEVRKCIGKKNLVKAIFKKFKKVKYVKGSNKIREKFTAIYEPEMFNVKNNAYFTGYFQSEKYFSSVREEILKSFTLKIPLNKENQEILDKIKSTNAVSLHVRRGDYVALQNIYGLCGLEYYKKAIEIVAEKQENPHFFLFSNDIKWVEENLKINFPYTVVDINNSENAYYDIELMRNCKHNIVANSSFSWWGAWLNENPDKIVIAPKQWFTDPKLKFDDLIPESWTKI